ncbi:hypothetical protein ABPG75_009963 [Micractinium tetrahymenae]
MAERSAGSSGLDGHVADQSRLLQRASGVIQALQVDVGGLLWEIDQRFGSSFHEEVAASLPTVLAAAAAGPAESAGAGTHQPASPEEAGEALLAAAQDRLALLGRAYAVIDGLSTDVDACLHELDMGAGSDCRPTPVPFPQLTPLHTTHTYVAGAAQQQAESTGSLLSSGRQGGALGQLGAAAEGAGFPPAEPQPSAHTSMPSTSGPTPAPVGDAMQSALGAASSASRSRSSTPAAEATPPARSPAVPAAALSPTTARFVGAAFTARDAEAAEQAAQPRAVLDTSLKDAAAETSRMAAVRRQLEEEVAGAAGAVRCGTAGAGPENLAALFERAAADLTPAAATAGRTTVDDAEHGSMASGPVVQATAPQERQGTGALQEPAQPVQPAAAILMPTLPASSASGAQAVDAHTAALAQVLSSLATSSAGAATPHSAAALPPPTVRGPSQQHEVQAAPAPLPVQHAFSYAQGAAAPSAATPASFPQRVLAGARGSSTSSSPFLPAQQPADAEQAEAAASAAESCGSSKRSTVQITADAEGSGGPSYGAAVEAAAQVAREIDALLHPEQAPSDLNGRVRSRPSSGDTAAVPAESGDAAPPVHEQAPSPGSPAPGMLSGADLAAANVLSPGSLDAMLAELELGLGGVLAQQHSRLQAQPLAEQQASDPAQPQQPPGQELDAEDLAGQQQQADAVQQMGGQQQHFSHQQPPGQKRLSVQQQLQQPGQEQQHFSQQHPWGQERVAVQQQLQPGQACQQCSQQQPLADHLQDEESEPPSHRQAELAVPAAADDASSSSEPLDPGAVASVPDSHLRFGTLAHRSGHHAASCLSVSSTTGSKERALPARLLHRLAAAHAQHDSVGSLRLTADGASGSGSQGQAAGRAAAASVPGHEAAAAQGADVAQQLLAGAHARLQQEAAACQAAAAAAQEAAADAEAGVRQLEARGCFVEAAAAAVEADRLAAAIAPARQAAEEAAQQLEQLEEDIAAAAKEAAAALHSSGCGGAASKAAAAASALRAALKWARPGAASAGAAPTCPTSAAKHQHGLSAAEGKQQEQQEQREPCSTEQSLDEPELLPLAEALLQQLEDPLAALQRDPQSCKGQTWAQSLAAQPVQVWRVQEQQPDCSPGCCPSRGSVGARHLLTSSSAAELVDEAGESVEAEPQPLTASHSAGSDGDIRLAAVLPPPQPEGHLSAPLPLLQHALAAGQDSAASMQLPVHADPALLTSPETSLAPEAEPVQLEAALAGWQPPAASAAAAASEGSLASGSTASSLMASSRTSTAKAHSSSHGHSSSASGRGQHSGPSLLAARARDAAAALAAKQQRALVRAQQADLEAERLHGAGLLEAAAAATGSAACWRKRADKVGRLVQLALRHASSCEAEAEAEGSAVSAGLLRSASAELSSGDALHQTQPSTSAAPGVLRTVVVQVASGRALPSPAHSGAARQAGGQLGPSQASPVSSPGRALGLPSASVRAGGLPLGFAAQTTTQSRSSGSSSSSSSGHGSQHCTTTLRPQAASKTPSAALLSCHNSEDSGGGDGSKLLMGSSAASRGRAGSTMGSSRTDNSGLLAANSSISLHGSSSSGYGELSRENSRAVSLADAGTAGSQSWEGCATLKQHTGSSSHDASLPVPLGAAAAPMSLGAASITSTVGCRVQAMPVRAGAAPAAAQAAPSGRRPAPRPLPAFCLQPAGHPPTEQQIVPGFSCAQGLGQQEPEPCAVAASLPAAKGYARSQAAAPPAASHCAVAAAGQAPAAQPPAPSGLVQQLDRLEALLARSKQVTAGLGHSAPHHQRAATDLGGASCWLSGFGAGMPAHAVARSLSSSGRERRCTSPGML